MHLFKVKRFLIILSVLLNISCAWASEQVVLLNGDRLTLDVRNQSLSTILGELSRQGIRIRVDPRIDPEISATFYNRPIGAAMNSILRSFDYALIWKGDKSSGSEQARLREIQIFYEGQRTHIRELEKNGNLNVVKQADGTYYVRDVLLIQAAPTMTKRSLTTLLDQLDATVLDVHNPLGILELRLPPGADVLSIAKSISSFPGVQTAEPDYAYRLDGASPVLVDRQGLSLPELPAQSTGTTKVAVMDSGLLPHYAEESFVQGTYDAVSPESEVNDLVGHGTQMTLIAAGVVNPIGVSDDTTATRPVVVIRAIDDDGFTSNYSLIRGIDYAILNEARVMSLSWGSETTSSLMESATSYATEKGLILVAAAGNEPTGKPVYPAAYDNVIGVGALTLNGEPWEKSNYGDFVAVQAPGLANLPVGFQGDPGTYVGTSIATAYTARRVAAFLDQTPDADLNTILQYLSTTVETNNESQ